MTAQPGPVAALETLHIERRYGGVTALAGVSISVQHAEIHGLIGPNGAGKTTLFDVISGVQPASSGRILLDAEDVSARSGTWRARHGIRRTFQRQQPFVWLSVIENLLVAQEWQGGGGGVVADILKLPRRARLERARKAEAEEILAMLGIVHLKDELAASLTIGQARLVELARAIYGRPTVLLLDEPTSGLPNADVEKIGEAITQIRQNQRCAVLLVEHDVGFVMELCDRITVLHLGSVLTAGTPAEVRDNEDVVEAYLGGYVRSGPGTTSGSS